MPYPRAILTIISIICLVVYSEDAPPPKKKKKQQCSGLSAASICEFVKKIGVI